MNTKTVVDQMTSMLAERRQQTRDRRTAYLALARAIVGEGPAEQHLSFAAEMPAPIGERRAHAA